MKPALKRYAPLLGLVGVLGVVVTVFPSVAASRTADPNAAADPSFVTPYVTASADPGATPDASSSSAAGPSAAAAGPTGAAATASAMAKAVASAKAGEPVGDTSHCVGGRQFDPATDFFAPPCVPTSNGTNPGATYPGVTGSTITMVDYYPQGNSAVDTQLKLEGLYVSIAQQRAWDTAAATFINSHYELYGRKVSIVVVQGTCAIFPPDDTCLRNEMDNIVRDDKPFLFRWITPLTSKPFDELDADKVVNLGGQLFTDAFDTAGAPYHWDVTQSGTRIADDFGQLWCGRLKGSPAAFSPATTPAGSVNGQARVLGVIGTNDNENILMRQELERVLEGCGASIAHTYDASNDISTAAAQKSAAVASMRQSPAATTVLCLCNPVGAGYVYQEEQQDSYFPENMLAGTVYTDLDDSGQSFMTAPACPSGTGCEFATMVGISTSEPRQPVGQDVGTRVWNAAGNTGPLPFPGVALDWDYWSMAATLIEGAGPNLTPGNLQSGAFATPLRGGGTTGHVLRGFPNGSHAWNQDAQVVAWYPKRVSPFNGKTGTYVDLGPRVTTGGFGTSPFTVTGR